MTINLLSVCVEKFPAERPTVISRTHHNWWCKSSAHTQSYNCTRVEKRRRSTKYQMLHTQTVHYICGHTILYSCVWQAWLLAGGNFRFASDSTNFFIQPWPKPSRISASWARTIELATTSHTLHPKSRLRCWKSNVEQQQQRKKLIRNGIGWKRPADSHVCASH